jgi:hypothetical protein|tara:strand:+ start:37 stop:210 length:174 start_codon:yes stop_codon:yes gene_type:complete
MNLTILIILCAGITLALVIFPLVVSYKAEKLKKQDEWEKIATFSEKINKKSRKNRLH